MCCCCLTFAVASHARHFRGGTEGWFLRSQEVARRARRLRCRFRRRQVSACFPCLSSRVVDVCRRVLSMFVGARRRRSLSTRVVGVCRRRSSSALDVSARRRRSLSAHVGGARLLAPRFMLLSSLSGCLLLISRLALLQLLVLY